MFLWVKYSLWVGVTLLFCGNLHAQSNLIDEVVAVVGDNAILLSDIEHQYESEMMEADGASYAGDLKCHVFEQQLLNKLLLNQAQLDSVEVNENEVVSQVDQRINYFINQIGDKDKLEEYFNKSMLQIKKDQMDMVRTQMLTQNVKRNITKDVSVTPSEIRAYYRRLPVDSLPQIPTQFELQQIVIYPKKDQKEIDRIKDQLRDFQKQINEGRDFATLAVLYSEDKGSAARGGELGWMPRSGLVPEFASVAFNLQTPNKVSKIVETEYGYHIIQLIERKGDRINCRHILLKPKVSTEALLAAKGTMDSIRGFIADKTLSFEEAALRFSMDKDSRSAGGLMINPTDGTSKFEIAQIPVAINLAIKGLNVGDVSPTFYMLDERKGKESYNITKLKTKNEPHKANMQYDYQLLKSMLVRKKESEVFENWIKTKQRETYITIDDKWIGCDFEYKGWIKH